MKMISFARWGVGLLLAILLTGCAPIAAIFATSTATALPPTVTLAPTNTLAPTATTPPIATFTLAPTHTETVTATQGPEFSKFNAFSFAKKTTELMMIGIQVPGLKKTLNITVNGKKFICGMDAAYPEKIFCTGPMLPIEKLLPIQFVSVTGDFVAFEGTITIPPVQENSSTPLVNSDNWCPERGKNVTCETENRTWYSPPCVVSSCFDACGYYYSIDTCQNSTP